MFDKILFWATLAFLVLGSAYWFLVFFFDCLDYY